MMFEDWGEEKRDRVSEIGRGFHVALRKGCDSFATSQAHGLVRLMTFGWTWFASALDEHREWIDQMRVDWTQTHPDDRYKGWWAEAFHNIVEHQVLKSIYPAQFDHWLDGEPIKRADKERERDMLLLFSYCLEKFDDDEVRVCLRYAGFIPEGTK